MGRGTQENSSDQSALKASSKASLLLFPTFLSSKFVHRGSSGNGFLYVSFFGGKQIGSAQHFPAAIPGSFGPQPSFYLHDERINKYLPVRPQTPRYEVIGGVFYVQNVLFRISQFQQEFFKKVIYPVELTHEI